MKYNQKIRGTAMAAAVAQAVSLMALGALGMPAQAEDVARAADASSGAAIEEVVVTARRRAENIQQVPQSITALSGEAMRELGITSAQDLSKLAGLSATPQVAQRDKITFSMRGQAVSYNADRPAVQIYFGGTPVSSANASMLYDLENVQVLTGPQGTLFGMNSTGGAVLFEPKKPTEKFEGYVEPRLGNHNLRGVEAVINVPFNDVLSARLGVNAQKRDGYTYDHTTGQSLDSEDYTAFRLGLMFKPNADIQNYLVFNSYDADNSGTASIPLRMDTFKVLAGLLGMPYSFFNAQMQANLARQQGASPREVWTSGVCPTFNGVKPCQYFDNRELWSVTDTLTWTPNDDITVKNILSYTREWHTFASDFLGNGQLALPFVTGANDFVPDRDRENYSNEFQVQGKAFDRKLDWIAGLFFMREETHGAREGGLSANFNPAATRMSQSAGQPAYKKDTSYAVFTQGTWAITDALKFTAGARYTWDKRRFITGDGTIGSGNTCSLDGVCQEDSATFKSPSWNLSLDYALNDRNMIYGTIRRGYKTGGFNQQNAIGLPRTYRPEHVTDYEIGLKSDWTVGSVQGRTNVAIYHDEFTNMQRFIVGTDPMTSALLAGVSNAGKAEIDGIELQLTIIPVSSLELSASIDAKRAKYTEYIWPATFKNSLGATIIAAGTDVSDMPVAYTPKMKASLGVKYYAPIPTSQGELTLQANVTYQSEYDGSETNFPSAPEPFSKLPSYNLWNLRADWKQFMGNENIDVGVFVNNAGDKEYRVGGVNLVNAAGIATGMYGAPRMYGASVKFRF